MPCPTAARFSAPTRYGRSPGAEAQYQFVAAGEREIKGLPEPIPVFEIQWEPASGTSGIPLPDRLETSSGSLFGFIGHERELESLIEDLKHCAEDARSVRFLSGEPGIGKTSLCKEVAQRAHDRGMCVLYGRCDEELVVSYQPFAEALGHLVVHADEALLSAHVEENGSALVKLGPGLGQTDSLSTRRGREILTPSGCGCSALP